MRKRVFPMTLTVFLWSPLKLQAIKRMTDREISACIREVFKKKEKGFQFHTPLFKLLWFLIFDLKRVFVKCTVDLLFYLCV